MSIKEINYTNKDSFNYQRVFANTSFVQAGLRKEVVIDFCEEYIDPRLMVRNVFDVETVYNRKEDELIVTLERKCSVTMNIQQALELADWIIQRFGQERVLK